MRKILSTAFLLLCTSQVQALEVTTWQPYYSHDAGYANLQTHGDKFTRLGLQFWYVNADGTLSQQSSDQEITRFQTLAKSKGIKILLTPYNADPDGNGGTDWNWPNGRSAFINNQDKFIANLLAIVDQYKLDGIDLDIEGEQEVETDYVGRYHYAQFVKKLNKELKARGNKILSIDAYAYHFNGPNDYWWEDWIYTADMVHVMGYEAIGAGVSGWQNYRHRQNWAISKRWNPSKVAMGLPTYDRNTGSTSWLGLTPGQHLDTLIKIKSPVAIWDLPSLSRWSLSEINKLGTIKGIAPQADASTPALDSAKLFATNWLNTPNLWMSFSDDLGTQRTPEDDAQLNQVIPGQVAYQAILAPNDADGNRWTTLRMNFNPNNLGENVGIFPGIAFQYSSNHPVTLRFLQSNPHGIDPSWQHAVQLPATNGQAKWAQIRWTDPKQPVGTLPERTWPFNHAQIRALDFAPTLPTTGATWNMNVYNLRLNLDTTGGITPIDPIGNSTTALQASGFEWHGGDLSWQVINLKGEKLHAGQVSTQGTIKWTPLSQGIYLLHLKTPQSQETKRFTVD
jgi:hypothetical protein